jgi:hypothetical protein
MIDPGSGLVVLILDAPGKYSWGLGWKDGHLINADYQDDAIYEIIVKDGHQFKTYEPRKARIDFTSEATASGAGSVTSLDINYAVPQERPNQKMLKPILYSPQPSKLATDHWGQPIAVFHFDNLEPPQSVEVSMRLEIETSAIRYFIYPESIAGEIPADIKKLYLADDTKYDITNPYIQKIVKDVVGPETNLYWKARKLFQYLIENMEYQLSGGWNTAPTVLKRGNGSCSEYSFSYISLCRAAGVPARYVGSLVVRGDDASYELPADQASAFGGIANRFLITTAGGGASEYLDWNYNAQSTSVTTGKCHVKIESIAEWEPLETK